MFRLRRLAAVPIAYYAARRLINGARRPGEPPFVRGKFPYLGDAMEFSEDAIAYLERKRSVHGDVFTIFVAGERMTFVLDPMDVPTVLKASTLSFSQTADEIMNSAFDVPRARERYPVDALEDLARSRLKGEHLPDLVAAMEARLREHHLEQLGDDWQNVGLYEYVWGHMFRAGTHAVFGRGLADEALSRSFADFDEEFPLLVAGLPKGMARRGALGLRTLQSRLGRAGEDPSEWVRRRLALLEGRDVGEVGRQQAAVLWALNANTIPATFWTLVHLLRHEEARQRAIEELRAVLGTAGPVVPELPTPKLDALVWLDACVRESLRLSSGSLMVRRAMKDTTLELRSGSVRVREGDRVCLAPHFTHHDPAIYPEPERYDPERFFVQSGVKQAHKHGERVPIPLMPFGAGSTMCPGRLFAVHEIKLFTVMTLMAADVQLLDALMPGPMKSRAGLGIFPPEHELRARIRRRRA